MDALLMGAYGPDANPKARRSIQTYISGYRKTMGVVIDRNDEGYILKVEPSSIDAVRFEDSIRSAKSIINEEMSSAVLREALDLWRGRPYQDVSPLMLSSQRSEDSRPYGHKPSMRVSSST
jgi:hypothetical protein